MIKQGVMPQMTADLDAWSKKHRAPEGKKQ